MTETYEPGEIKLNMRYPESRLEDVTDAYMRGFEVGLAMRADENAKLREELAKWERLTAGINLPDYPVSQFVPKDLERENEKLRELVQDAMPIVCNGCHERLCKMPKEEHPFITCWFADRLFELGIEVD